MAHFSNTQRLIWTGQALYPGTPLYNMGRAFFIEGALDPAAFERSWQSVVDRSDALRTVVEVGDGGAHPRVRRGMAGGMRHVDLAGRELPEDAATAWAAEACRAAFDPAERLFDTALVRLGDERWMWYLNQHHLITDAWSASVVYRRMSEAYAAAESGAEPDADPWPAFAEYVEYERSLAASPVFQAAESYWLDRFGERRVPAPFYGRPKGTTTRSTRVTYDLGASRSQRIVAMASSPEFAALTPHLSQFNIFATVLAAFMLRVTGDTSATFGAVSHNRPSPAFQQTIGAMIELLPMQVRATPGETWISLHGKVREAANQFLSHAQPGTSRAEYHSRYNATLNYLTVTFPDFAGRPAYAEPVYAGHADAHHALRLHVQNVEATGDFVLQFDCNEDVFDAAQREEAIGHFMKLLDGCLAAPGSRLDEVDVLSAAERRRLVVDWNASAHPPPEGETIPSRFASQAARWPDRQAVVVAGAGPGLTYRDLDAGARSLSRRLVALGAGPDAPVAVCMPPSEGSVVAMLAASTAGAAFVPIDHKNPPGRVEQMLREAKAAALVVDGSADLDLPAVCATVDWRKGAARRPASPQSEAAIGADAAAYVYFTSGSTGAPKGVRLGHAGLLNLLDDFEAMGPLPAGAPATWWTSIGFDVSAYEIFGTLLFGHTLHVVPEAMRADTHAFIRYLQEASIQSAYVPPFMLDALADACEDRPDAFDLRRILVGVEPIPEQVLRRIDRALPRLTLINGYGPTEATTCATLYRVGEGEIGDRVAPIGRPVRNNQLYVLSGGGRPQPAGVAGELYIGGAGLALGYLDPADEEGRFVPDPFGVTDRLYRTGDLARLLPDGNLAFLGRVDHQIKLGGFRIEPGEVEFALNGQPDVAGSVVTAVARGGAAGGSAASRLVAYVVPRGGATIDPADLRMRLRSDLPPYMVPSAFVIMERFPMTANGKVDRAALPAPAAGAVAGSAVAAPTTEGERTLAEIWAAVLGVDRVGIHDDLFELGGDSITAIQIATRAASAGLRITTAQLFDTPTIAALAAVAGAADPGQPEAAAADVSMAGLDGDDLARLAELLE